MKRCLNRKRSASASVMVLIMSVIVITLGLSFVLLSKTNFKLAAKNVDWLSDYYRLESLLNEDISSAEEYLKGRFAQDKLDAESLEEAEKDLSALLHSTAHIETSLEGLKMNLFLESGALKDRNSGSRFAISCRLRYDPVSAEFFVDALEEMPPEMEYDSFY